MCISKWKRIMAMVMILFLTTAAAEEIRQEDESMANYREDIVNIELSTGLIHRSFLKKSIGEGDKKADRFGVRAYRNGVPENLSGTCSGLFIRADGATVPVSDGYVSGNLAYVTLPETCYAVEGYFSLAIKVTTANDITTLRIVDGMVSRTSTDVAADPGTIIPSIEALIEAIDEAVASIPEDYSALQNAVYTKTRNMWLNPEYNSGGVVISENADGSIHISGTPGEALFIGKEYVTALPMNAYTFSCIKKGTASGNISVILRNTDNTAPKTITLGSAEKNGYSVVSYAPKRCEVVLYSGVAYDCDLYVQLESGTTRTPWIRNGTGDDVVAREILPQITNHNALMTRANNYKVIFEVDDSSMVEKWGSSDGVMIHDGKTISYSIATANNGGFLLNQFNSSEFILQNTRIEMDITKTAGSVRMWMYGKSKSSGTDLASVIQIMNAGHNTLDIDFAYYDVYTDFDISKPIRFLITNGGAEAANFTASNIRFSSLITAQGYVDEYKNALLFQALDAIVAKIPEQTDAVYLKSPNGSRWLLNVSNTGELSTTPITPHKSIFIGNSLLKGWVTFGMAATDDEHDYYYHVTNKIHQLDGTATYDHISQGNLEHSTNQSDFNTAFNNIKPYLTADLDLICIQLGDNVNTPEKVTQFEKSGGSFETMVGWIRENCPNTRLVWVGTWYKSIHDWLMSACADNNIQFIDILPLSVSANKAKLGDIIHRTEDHEQTLEGTYTASGSALNCTLTMYGGTYSVTIPAYTSVTNNGDGTFTVVGPYTVVDSTGVMSHPNNAGMKAIADTILASLGI